MVLSPDDVALLRRAATTIESRMDDTADEEMGEYLAFLLRTLAHGRDLDTVLVRALSLARVIEDEWVKVRHDARCDRDLCHPACAVLAAQKQEV